MKATPKQETEEQKIAAAFATKLASNWDNPEIQAYYRVHPELQKQRDHLIEHALGAARGEHHFDWHAANDFGGIEDAVGTGGGAGGAGGEGAPPPQLSTPAGFQGVGTAPVLNEPAKVSAMDRLAQGPGPSIGMTPAPPLLANQQLQIPPRRELPPPTFGSVPPHVLANEVLQDFSGQNVKFGPEPAPPAPAAPAATTVAGTASTAADKPPPPNSKEGILAQINAAQLEEPPPKGDYQTDKSYQRDVQTFYTNQDRKIRRLSALMVNAPRAAILQAQADVAVPTAEAKLESLRAGAEANREKSKTERTLRGVKKDNYTSMIEKRSNDTKQRNRQMSETERSNKVREDIGWMNAQTSRARQEDMSAYYSSMKAKTQYMIDHASDANLRALLGANLKVLTSSRDILDDPTFDDETRQEAAAAVDALSKQLAAKSRATPASGGAKITMRTPQTPLRATARAGLQATDNQERRSGLTFKEFEAEGLKRNKRPEVIRQQWGRLK